MLISTKEEQTLFELCAAPCNFAQTGGNIQMKTEVFNILFKILPQTLRLLQQDMHRWGSLLGEFFRFCKVQFDINGPDVELAELAK
jgi:hypothetical protein